ncbi:MAG: GDP-mannose 4,6-dehydratase, partial [Flavobacteriales bacterium]
YVEVMWMMMQQDEPDDYVLATGETHSVKHFCNLAFAHIGINLEWKGEGVEEKAFDAKTGKALIEIDPKYFRPTEVDLLIGNPAKAYAKLGWKHKHTLEQLVTDMVKADVELFKRDRYLMEGGHNVLNYHE